jgi:FkbM family methyltransferase
MTPDIPSNAARQPLDTGEPVYIYGAGNVGKDVCRLLRARGFKVAGFLDRRAKPGESWEGIPLHTPEDTALSEADRARAQVVIGIFNRETEIPPVVRLLESLRFGRIITFVDLHASFPAELGDRFWLTSREFYGEHRDEIEAADKLFADETSRDLFRALLRFRLTGDYTALPAPSPQDQYFPEGLPAWRAPLRLVDCGAYDGDTLRAVADRKLAVEAVAAFEPDPANFSLLAQTARELLPGAATVCLFPCGVDASTRQVHFASGQGSSSCVSESGETVIQCVSLDDALPAFAPNLIKMDIEGAEFDALLGARRLIEQHRPGLAISVYHRAEHLLSIPLLAASWLKGGRHFLRSHAYTGFELIYYWLP